VISAAAAVAAQRAVARLTNEIGLRPTTRSVGRWPTQVMNFFAMPGD
jgi:hypothetical protein